MWNWMAANWWYSIPLGAAAVYLVCVAAENLVYQSLNIKAKDAPAKGDFPKSITLLEALAVFDFLLWYNCGAVLWRRGLRPWLLPLFCVLLVFLAVEWTRASPTAVPAGPLAAGRPPASRGAGGSTRHI